MKAKTLVIILVVLAVAAAGYFLWQQRASASAPQFQTVPVERGRLIATVGATGTVRARQSVVLAWQTSGQVEKVNVQVGDRVQTGQALAWLAPTSVAQNIILAQAELVSAQQALEELLESDTARIQALIALRSAEEAYEKAKDRYELMAKGNYEYQTIEYINFRGRRIATLKTVKVDQADSEVLEDARVEMELKKAQYEDAQRAYDRIKDGPHPDDVAAAQARVDAARATLEQMYLIAPFSAIVTEAYPLPGDRVSPGTLGFRLDDLSELLVDVEVSEVDINSVRIGQPVTLTFDAVYGKEYQGKVVKVTQAGQAIQGVVNFTVTVQILDPDDQVKPGMTAAVTIVVNELEDVVLIPNRSVRLVDGKRVVYVLRNGQPVQTLVRLGQSSDTMSVLVDGQVNVGDLIILNPPTVFESDGRPPFAR